MPLTRENYKSGFLLDEQLMGGVTDATEAQGKGFLAFVLRHTTGEYLGYAIHEELDEALAAVNQVERGWEFEKTSGCGGGSCGTGEGECAKGIGAVCGKNACDGIC